MMIVLVNQPSMLSLSASRIDLFLAGELATFVFIKMMYTFVDISTGSDIVTVPIEVATNPGPSLHNFPYPLYCHLLGAVLMILTLRIMIYNPDMYLSHWSTLFSCPLIVNTLDYFSTHGMSEYCGQCL